MDVKDEDVLRVLLDVALELAGTRDLGTLMKVVLERATQLVDAQRALFGVFGDDGDREQPFTYNLPEGQGELLPVSHSLIQRVLERRETILVSDVDVDQVFSSRHSVKRNGIQFMVGVPVIPSRAPMGVLYIDSQVQVVQDISLRVEVLELIAGLVAKAVDNAYLIDNMQEREREIRSWVHGMRSMVTAVHLTTDFLGKQSGEADGEVVEAIEDLQSATAGIKHSLDTVLDLSRLDSDFGDEPEVLDVGEELERHVAELRRVAKWSNRELELDVQDGLPQVQGVRSRLGIVLDNLVFNAVKYATDERPVVVRAMERSDAGPPEATRRPSSLPHRLFRRADRFRAVNGCRFVEVAVNNPGPVMSPQAVDALFVQAKSTANRLEVRSSGLGLPIADECVRRWGGAIWADSREGEGTTFHFTVPTHVLRT